MKNTIKSLSGRDAAVSTALGGVLQQAKLQAKKSAWYTQPSRKTAKVPLLMLIFLAVIGFSIVACSKSSSSGVTAQTNNSGSSSSQSSTVVSEAPESDFTVTLTSDNTGVVITAYKGSSATVRIPATIQGLSVKEIEGAAFSNNKTITSVTIPEGVTSIGRNVFQACTNLSSVNLPSTLTSLGQLAFNNCSSLTSINLPTGLTEIGVSVFWGSGLTSFPDPWPRALTTVMYGMFHNTKLRTIVIPEGITEIAQAFNNCSDLTSVTLPSTISRIDKLAFINCSSLTTVNIPESVTSIEFFGPGIYATTFNGSNMNLASQARLRGVGYTGNF
jgi:hypothetical protein